MLEKVKKNIFISLGAAAVIYLLLTVYADYNDVAASFIKFNWLWLPLILLLSLLNFIVRFIKWDFYLNILKIKIAKIDSFSIFMSGLIMSVTPGKMGELLKSYLVKQITGESISKTAPIIMVERITDFLSLVLLAIIGAYAFDYGRIIVISTGVFFILITILLSSRNFAIKIIQYLEKIKYLKKHIYRIETAYESAYFLLRPKPLFYMVIISLFSWFFECMGYYLVMVNFNINLGILWATFVYTFSTIVGAITMLPGGLGVTDGSLTLLMTQKNVPLDIAVSSTFIIRVMTLWVAVLIGVFSVSFYQKRFGKITVQSVIDTQK